MDEDNFEKFPGEGKIERAVPREQDFSAAMNGVGAEVPEFTGEQFGTANAGNEYYGEGGDNMEEQNEERNAGIADAAALINYGLNAVARDRGVGYVIGVIKGFDPDGSEDPMMDLFISLGIDTQAEVQEVDEENEAAKLKEEVAFRKGINAPLQERSVDGARAAIKAIKELITEVEGADPRFGRLRTEATAADKDIFDYAVEKAEKEKKNGTRGLTELFDALAMYGKEDTANKMADTSGEEAKEEPGVLGTNSEESKSEVINEDGDEIKDELGELIGEQPESDGRDEKKSGERGDSEAGFNEFDRPKVEGAKLNPEILKPETAGKPQNGEMEQNL